MDVASLLAQQEGVIMRSTPSALRKSNTRDLTTLQQQLRALADRTLDVQRAAAVKYEKFMENTFRRMPDVYRELQQEGRVKMARPGVPATLQQKGRVASDKTQSGSRKGKVAASKSSKGKRRASEKQSNTASPSKSAKRTKAMPTNGKNRSHPEKQMAVVVPSTATQATVVLERPKQPEHDFWQDVDAHFQVPTQTDIKELHQLRKDIMADAATYFQVPALHGDPQASQQPSSVLNGRVHINSLQPSTLALRLLGVRETQGGTLPVVFKPDLRVIKDFTNYTNAIFCFCFCSSH
eukprot:m.141829 g.141829  ORF g.141829 m.141829 type:complete len:294 (+) comp15984_c1_seq10:114-995(+)